MEAADAQEGLAGTGMRFDGGDEAVHVVSDALDLGSSLTVEAWGRIDGTYANYQRLYQKGAGSADRSVELFVLDTSGQVAFRTSYRQNAQWDVYAIPGFSVGDWHYFVGVFDDVANRLRIYVDGQLQTDVAQTLPILTGYPDHYIGNWDSTSFDPRNWNGVIDEVRISDTPRTSEWIATSYASVLEAEAFAAVGDEESP
jgi:hypothetical protein